MDSPAPDASGTSPLRPRLRLALATTLLAACAAATAAPSGAVRLLQWEGPVDRPVFGSYVGEPDIAPELLTEGFLAAHPDIRWRREGLHAFHHKRYDEALDCFRRAATYADKASMAMLAEMHWEGLGVPRDRPIAYAWMDLAAERMYPNFTILRERYWRELSKEEQEAAIERGQALMKALRGRLSGLAQPTYVLDVPGGHGKVPVGPSYLSGYRGDDPDALLVEDAFGRQHRYPR